ncbi:hypothetical protein ACLOJK_035882 [Asimina triloba]
MTYLLFLFLSLPFLIAPAAARDAPDRDHQTCVHEHFTALLDLKRGFNFEFSASNLSSWNVNNRDCCSWEGIACNTSTGHVISLNLRELEIVGFFNFSSLFRLRSLRKLDLSLNSFHASLIPSTIYHLASLTHLNLSFCNFYGQIPFGFARLTRLVSLDLSYNNEYCFDNAVQCNNTLSLKRLGMRGLLQKLSSLRELHLDMVDLSTDVGQALSHAPPGLRKLSMEYCRLSGPIHPPQSPLRLITHIDLSKNNLSSPVPDFIASFTSLTSFNLQTCGLHGEFPKSIFNLPGLKMVDISWNPLLTGYLPEFSSNSSIQTLTIDGTGFYGNLPNSLGNLKSLTKLSFMGCNLSGPIPQSLENLSKLVSLNLANNSLSGPIPQSLVNLTQLSRVDLSNNKLTGPVPSAWFSLPSLVYLDMSYNHFNGELGSTNNPSTSPLVTITLNDNNLQGPVSGSLFQLTKLGKLDLSSNNFSSIEFGNLSSSMLQYLDLHRNNFQGPMPSMISEFTELRSLDLSTNNFSGVVDFGLFHNHTYLYSLDFSYNSLTAIVDTRGKSMPASFPQLASLNLRSCNIDKFPIVLRNQVKMYTIDLSGNEISGKIPKRIWTVGNGSLDYLNLSHNAFETIEGPLSLLTSTSVGKLDLSFNKLEGLIPIPPLSALFFSISDNKFRGDVPSQICSAAFLEVIDLSHNNFNGMIPKCLGGMSDVLYVLKLGGNNFNGTLLQTFKDHCNLRTIDLNGNRLEGYLRESLANCKMLEVLDIGNNQIYDTFPVWLKNLRQLRVLILRSNQLHGTLEYHPTVGDFTQLQIFDVSLNNFTGRLQV